MTIRCIAVPVAVVGCGAMSHAPAQVLPHVKCNDFQKPRGYGGYVAFGVFDECFGEWKLVRVELHARPFPAAGERPLCTSTQSLSRLELRDFQFASAHEYLAAAQTSRVAERVAFGLQTDKFKRRFGWARVTLAAPLACQEGGSVRTGWLSTRDVMEMVERSNAVPIGSWNGRLAWPAEERWPAFLPNQVVSSFGSDGEERRPVGRLGRYGANGLPRRHDGVDVALRIGTPVLAPAGGVVVEKGYNHRSGWYLRIRHDARTFSHFAHNEDISVRLGEGVSAHQRVGTVGFGGNGTVPHLHFSLNRDGDFIDPMPFLPPPLPRSLLAARSPVPRTVRLWLGRSLVNRTVSTASLRAWVESGEVSAELGTILQHIPERDDLRRILSRQLALPFSIAQFDEFLRKSPAGARLVEALAGIFHTQVMGTDPVPAVRGAFVLLAADGRPFGALDVLENFPLRDINVNVRSILPAVAAGRSVLEDLQALNQVHPL